MTGSEMNKLTVATMQVEVLRKQLADAQATVEALQDQYSELLEALDCVLAERPLPSGEYVHRVSCNGDRRKPAGTVGISCSCRVGQQQVEALQRERDEAIEAASLPTWVCDGCGRVSSDGWINHVIESLDGTDYEMECPTCGVRDIEEDCALDLVRERDDLQAALDAERERSKRQAEEAIVVFARLSQLQALMRGVESELAGIVRRNQGGYIKDREAIDKCLALIRTLPATPSADGQGCAQHVGEEPESPSNLNDRLKRMERDQKPKGAY